MHEAVVQRWAPIAEDGTGDVALLRLTGPAPPEVRVPPLRRVDRLWDHEFRVLGFPGDRPDGVWSSGLIRGEQSTRWFQLQSTPGEQRIEGGFSGSPVWDGQTGAVVGMTAAADRGDTTSPRPTATTCGAAVRVSGGRCGGGASSPPSSPCWRWPPRGWAWSRCAAATRSRPG